MKKKRRAALAAEAQLNDSNLPANDAAPASSDLRPPDDEAPREVTAVEEAPVAPAVNDAQAAAAVVDPAAPAPVTDRASGASFDDEMRLFFARGEAIETGDVVEEPAEPWRDRGARFAGLSLPQAAAVSLGLLLAGIWFLVH
jgi:hypothetical protein